MVVVVLTKAIEDGDVPEVRAGIAAENPAAAASANERIALQPTPNNAKRHQRPALHV